MALWRSQELGERSLRGGRALAGACSTGSIGRSHRGATKPAPPSLTGAR